MTRRQPLLHSNLPKIWLFTDGRMGNALWPALRGLPAGAAVVVRHYDLPHSARVALARKIVALARQQGLTIMWAGDARTAQSLGCDGIHTAHGRALPPKSRYPNLIRSVPVHTLRDIRRAERSGADLLFLSPIFATRSHPEGAVVGPLRAAALGHSTRLPVLALGGMSPRRFLRMMQLGHYGWAGIDAFIR